MVSAAKKFDADRVRSTCVDPRSDDMSGLEHFASKMEVDRAVSTGDARRQLRVAVDSQGGTPSKPTFKDLKQEAQRKAKAWRDTR